MSEEEKNVYKNLFEYPTKKIAGLEKENEELRQRIDKAIKYINSNPNVFYDENLIDVETLLKNEYTDKYVGDIKFISKLLSILKGEDREE